LIVDAALEASGAPIHELDGSLGLDGGNCRIHILWHHISWANEYILNQVNRLVRRRKRHGCMHIGQGPRQDGVNHRDKVHGSTHRALDWSLKQRQEATVIRLSAESPRYIMQQAMYLPWRGSHFTIIEAGSNTDMVISATESCSWYAFSAEMTGA
jgi:hypothetical protein